MYFFNIEMGANMKRASLIHFSLKVSESCQLQASIYSPQTHHNTMYVPMLGLSGKRERWS